MEILLELLILVVAAVVVFMIAKYIMGQADFDPPIQKIVLLILGIVFLVWLVNILSGGAVWGPMLPRGRLG